MEPSAEHNAPWRFYLFGGLRIFFDQNEIQDIPQRCIGLLAFLLLKPQIKTREGIIGYLFPELPEVEGRSRLSDRLWLLRKSMPDLPVQAGRQELFIPKRSRWVDVEAFSNKISSNDDEQIQQAVDLYQGDLLPREYDDWLLVKRERVHLQYLRGLSYLGEKYYEERNYEKGEAVFQELLQLDPLNESALRSLMRIYKQIGRRGAALSAYETYEILAEQELGISPEMATKVLADTLYRIEPKTVSSQFNPTNRSCQEVLTDARAMLNCGDREYVLTAIGYLDAHQDIPPEILFDLDLLKVDFHFKFDEISAAKEIVNKLDQSRLDVVDRLAKISYQETDYVSARELAIQALLAAHHQQNSRVEVSSLITLARSEIESGEASSPITTINKAISIARKNGLKHPLVRALYHKGVIYSQQGAYSDSLAIMREVLSLSLDCEFRVEEIDSHMLIARSYRIMGEYADAIEHYEQALVVSRDIGLPDREAAILQGLATCNDNLGNHSASIRQLQASERIYQQKKDRFGFARNIYHLAWSYLYKDDSNANKAVVQADQAIEIFEDYHQGWLASTYTLLGYALWVDGQPQKALSALDRAIELHTVLDEKQYLPELYAYKGLAYKDIGDLSQAIEYTNQALLLMARGEFYAIAIELYYAHGAVLMARNEKVEAEKYFQRAYDGLLSYAEEIEEEEARSAYFKSNPTIRRLMAEVYELGIASYPESKIIKGKAENPIGRLIDVKWTLDAGPSDVALKNAKGSIAVRRVRLARILKESKHQGGMPTHKQLAELFGVSTRTIRRDITAIQSS